MSRLPDEEGWLEGCPARLRGPILRCARGETPPNVALMRLLAEAADPKEAEAALARALDSSRSSESANAGAETRLGQALAFARANPQAFTVVKAVLGGVDHRNAPNPDEDVAHWAAVFDRAAQASPEGSVALYALGNPDLLRAATGEVVNALSAWGLLGPERAVLEIGCGIGRLLAALAPAVDLAVGIDISRAMIVAAERRCAGLSNVHVLQSSGRDLSAFRDASFDLVLAADSFPYLVQSAGDLAERHVRDAARALKSAGHLVILNFSYRGDPEADRADVARLAADTGFSVLRNGARPFRLWDGLAFHLAKRR